MVLHSIKIIVLTKHILRYVIYAVQPGGKILPPVPSGNRPLKCSNFVIQA